MPSAEDFSMDRNLSLEAVRVTDGAMLRGVRRYVGGAATHSIVMRSKTGTVRRIEATHNFNRKTDFQA